VTASAHLANHRRLWKTTDPKWLAQKEARAAIRGSPRNQEGVEVSFAIITIEGLLANELDDPKEWRENHMITEQKYETIFGEGASELMKSIAKRRNSGTTSSMLKVIWRHKTQSIQRATQNKKNDRGLCIEVGCP
jgi:hypothetical protein